MQENLRYYEERLDAFGQMQDLIADSSEMVNGFQKSSIDIQQELEQEKEANDRLSVDLEQERMRSQLLFQILKNFKMKMLQSASKLPPSEMPAEFADTWHEVDQPLKPSYEVYGR
eukprot:GHVL01014616.1.p1 GENE.GHVL01014616.1~~GHVL01014616.1.p1  ORF type:complete len:115 (+),score=22.73 GHVL01014616.1:268-612(+)